MLAVETGAGLSTVWLLMLGCKVHSFVLDEAVVEKIEQFLANYPEIMRRWTPHVGASEVMLPSWTLANRDLSPQIALIDGGHGIQTAFVDFVYINLLLQKGSMLLIDDQQLGAVKLLNSVLVGSKEFERADFQGKLASYRKRLDNPLLRDWKSQESIQARLAALL
ncbi:MAG: class I SAM-dependent methyltransferase [Anaerolineae bacterium]